MIELLIQNALANIVFFLFPAWRIFKRAGLHPALSLMVIIPYLGFLAIGIILGASKWNLGVSNQGGK